jgi:hypothetical protein
MIKRESPTIYVSNQKEPTWFENYSKYFIINKELKDKNIYDKDGFNNHGYDNYGFDRAGYVEKQYTDGLNGDVLYNKILSEYDFDGEKPILKINKKYKEIIVLNKCQCKLCGDIIESNSTHSFVSCKCGEIYTDGGKSYLHRGANDLNNIIDLSEFKYEKILQRKE